MIKEIARAQRAGILRHRDIVRISLGRWSDAADAVGDYIESLPPDRCPNLREVADQFAAGDRDESFELLLDLFVDGLAARARA